MNIFDAVVIVALVVAVITGFKAGLLRSAVTILAYLVAMPLAVWLISLLSPRNNAATGAPLAQNSLLFFAVFLVAGMALGKMARLAIDENHRI
jgi:membrane protein required for colicin V production